MRRPYLAAAALTAAAAALLTGCGSGDDGSPSRPTPSAVGRLGAGFVAPGTTPAPESTVTPQPGSWDGVRPSDGYRVTLVTAGDGQPVRTVVEAVREWAEEQDVGLETVTAAGDSDLIPAVTRAMDTEADLIVSAGDDLVDPLVNVTPNHLDQQFLVVGAELAEPTENVTAVDWTGASFRGEGLGTPTTYDAASFTPARCAAAVRAGTAAVLSGRTGIVVWMDDF
ncbi:hypothetical protein [Streptomyces olivaceus]|uniref:hypothetical protein n=1 Tax=Streptomyces olivaceus TaxID=47716 RepID=UPI0022EF9BBF|nr:hypothetical protein [Streptomyces olivaceus]GHI95393.1 hypothetical protein TPA0905_48640 [Streptomyces olivaceus]